MAKAGRRGGGRKEGWKGYLLSFLLGAFLTLGGYFYFAPEKTPPKAARRDSFSQTILLVDRVIKSQLYEMGFSKRDILDVRTSPRKTGTIAWNQSFMKIQTPRSLPFSMIEGNFKESLASLEKSVSLQSVQKASSLRLDVMVEEQLTHQLTFIPSTPSAPPKAGHVGFRPKIAFVIDDLGEDVELAQELLRWDVPITFSILPYTPHGKSLALEAHGKGKEIILHLPMEPRGYPKTNPGKGVLLESMSRDQLLQQLAEDLEAVPHAKGVSNHMGSRLMEDGEKLKTILSELKRRGLYFLDSRTTAQTEGLETARSLGLKAGERNLFLDHSGGEAAVKQSVERLIQIALSNGKAIGIGHPHAATLRSLKAMIPKIEAKGIEIVPLSEVLE
jgi:polysaccharide deacetylase 2 family uncharacterized protein YibQ